MAFEFSTQLSLTMVAACVALPLGLVFALLACMQCFKRKTGFSNFNSSASPSGSGHVNNTFTMEISEVDDDLAHSTTVTIEPLPDIVSKPKLPPSILRPRISAAERTRADSALKLLAHHQFPRSQLVYLKELGTGWFGKAIESDAEKIVTGVPRNRVVVKMLKDDATKDEQQLFLEEVSPFRELEHANILRLLGQCTEINPMLLVLEAAAFGNLKHYLRGHRQHKATLIQKNRLLQFGIDAACGLACLHRHDYLHKDLSARNCLVMGDYTVKIGDYGIAEDLYQEDYFSCGNDLLPIRWMAPETLKQDNGTWVAYNFSKESDIWSLGVLLWEIAMMGERPYDMLTDEAVLQGVIVEKVIRLPEPDIGLAQKDRMYEVMKYCWLDKPERTRVDEVHGLLQQVAAKAGSAPEGDIAEFEKKWEHLMPNQRRPSVDSLDEERVGRQISVSSADSDILNDLSEPNVLDDFLGPELESTPVAPPRSTRKKVSASAVAVPSIEETPEPSPVTTNVRPAWVAPPPPKLEVAPAGNKTPKPTPATNGDAAKPPLPPASAGSTAPSALKSPCASETEFTEFTSHDTADETSRGTPNVSAVSAPEDIFTTSEITILEVVPPRKAPAGAAVAAENTVLSAVSHARLEEESFGVTTPTRPVPKERKTSTPIAKAESSTSTTSATDSSSSATFLTAHTSSRSSMTGNYVTASDTTVFSEQDKTSTMVEFSTFEEVPSWPADNTESFVVLETTSVPPSGTDVLQKENPPWDKKSDMDQLDVTPNPSTAASSPSPSAGANPTVNREDSFGEFTNASEEDQPDNLSVVKEQDDNHTGIAAPSVEASGFMQLDFPSLPGDLSLEASQAERSETTPGPANAGVEDESTQEIDHFLSFGTELSSLNSSTASVPSQNAEEKEFPSFATDLSSMSSWDTTSTATPQAQQQEDPFGFGQTIFSTDTPQMQQQNDLFGFGQSLESVEVTEPPKPTRGNPFTSSGAPDLGDFVSFDTLSFPPVTAGTEAEKTGDASTEIQSQEKDAESSKDGSNSRTQDLFSVSSTSSEKGTSDSQSNPFGVSVSTESRNQGGDFTDLFGFGYSAPQMQVSAPAEANINILDSKDSGQQENTSSSQPPVGSSLGEFDLLGGFSSPTASLADPEGSYNPFSSQGDFLQEFMGPSEAAATKVGTSVENKNDNINGASCEAEWSSPSTDTDSTSTSDSGKEYICEEPWPESPSPSTSPNIDSEEYALQLATEIYLSKGLKMARSFETPTLEPIPEDPLPSEESAPTPSETSSVDVRFEDVFEWDDFMGESLVGKEQTSEGSPKQSFEIPDWTLDVDSESLRSSSSVHSFRSEDTRSAGSETQSAGSAETPSARSSISDSEVTLHGRNRTHRSYMSDILSNRTRGLTLNSYSTPARGSTSQKSQRQFYSLYEEDFDLGSDSDSHSEGSYGPADPDAESRDVHSSVGGPSMAVHADEPRLPLTHIPIPDTGLNGAHTNIQDSQDEVLVAAGGDKVKTADKSTEDSLLDFSTFESADSGVTSATSDNADNYSSSASGTNGASLIDF